VKDRAFILVFLPLLIVLSLVRDRLALVHEKEVRSFSIHEGLAIIARNGGTLDGAPEDLANHQAMGASLTAAVGAPFAGEDPSRTHEGHHEDGHHHHPEEDHDHHEEGKDPQISSGMILILHHLGLGELAANLLWIQMDADSHAGLWHRVNFYLELIPALDPHFIDAFLLHAHVLDHAFKKHEEAVALLEKAALYNQYRYEIFVQLGVYYLNMDSLHGPKRFPEKALQSFAHALSLTHPPHVERFYAYALAALERRPEAIAFLESNLKQKDRPEEEKAHDRRAMARIAGGEKF